MSTATCDVVPQIISILMEGFLGTDPDCVAACRSALGTLGENVKGTLRQAACRAPRIQRNRLTDLLHAIDNRLYQGRQLHTELVKALVACLSGKRPELRQTSLEILHYLPRDDMVQTLVREAAELVHSPARCMRLLDAVQALGGCTRGSALMQLTTLQLARHRGIRQAASKLYRSVVFGPSTVVDAGGPAFFPGERCQETQTLHTSIDGTPGAANDLDEQDDNCPFQGHEGLQ